MPYKIDKNIPIPKYGRGKRPKYPFENMEVGDSFEAGDYSRDIANSLNGSAKSWCRYMNRRWKFTIRKTLDNKIRIWRIK